MGFFHLACSLSSGRMMRNRMIARACGERMAQPQAAADMSQRFCRRPANSQNSRLALWHEIPRRVLTAQSPYIGGNTLDPKARKPLARTTPVMRLCTIDVFVIVVDFPRRSTADSLAVFHP